jgi:hypothetical protein
VTCLRTAAAILMHSICHQIDLLASWKLLHRELASHLMHAINPYAVQLQVSVYITLPAVLLLMYYATG